MLKVGTLGRSPMLVGEPAVTQKCKGCEKDIAINGWFSDYCPFCLPEVVRK